MLTRETSAADSASLDPGAYLTGMREVAEALAAGKVGVAVGLYARRSSSVSARSLLERQLVAAIVRTRPQLGPVSWTDEVLARPSGATLAFVAAQQAGHDMPLGPGLTRFPPISHDLQRAVATAWLWRPACHGLRDGVLRQGFAEWLAATPEAIGPCLLSAAHTGDSQLIARLGPTWIARGVFHAAAPEQIEQASRFRDLHASVGGALDAAVGIFSNDSCALLHLLAASFAVRRYASVLAIGEILLERGGLQAGQAPRVLSLLLWALAELDRFEAVASTYRDRWMPLGLPFPEPERLLYALQREGEAVLERHLLEAIPPTADTSTLIRLRRDLVRKGATKEEDLDAWSSLYDERQNDERVLVGTSEALLLSATGLRQGWGNLSRLLEQWEDLAGYEPYRLLAGSYLVLLQPTHPDRIDAFQRWLDGAPLKLSIVRRAARAYVTALRQGKRWDVLRDLAVRWPDIFDLACTFKERELARLQGRLVDLPGNEAGFRVWCAGWERLLSLPLWGDEVGQVLDQFIGLRDELERRAPDLAVDHALADIELQILRRAKAEAERRLARPGHPASAGPLRSRLQAARLEGMPRLLEELRSVEEEHV